MQHVLHLWLVKVQQLQIGQCLRTLSCLFDKESALINGHDSSLMS